MFLHFANIFPPFCKNFLQEEFPWVGGAPTQDPHGYATGTCVVQPLWEINEYYVFMRTRNMDKSFFVLWRYVIASPKMSGCDAFILTVAEQALRKPKPFTVICIRAIQ